MILYFVAGLVIGLIVASLLWRPESTKRRRITSKGVDWETTTEQRREIRHTLSSAGWGLLRERLEGLRVSSTEFVLGANKYEDWLFRKGFLAGVEQVCDLPEKLITVAEDGGPGEWLENKTQKAAESLRSLLEPLR